MKLRSWFLQFCLAVACVLAVIFCLIVFPRMTGKLMDIYRHPVASWFFAAGWYGAALGFFVGADQASRLLVAANRHQAFTPRVVQLLRRFKWAMAGAAASLCLILPQFFVAADQEDAPGLFVIGCGIVAVPFVVAVFLAVLQRLWQTALTYKEENDLTV
ncbi:DUF2975 domain-containing protein [Schleiferilactobacillus harbinensis]|uniref:DUF2975 domain-containing protein n=1 Tax=Schleiferilactobacillus harbinensis TaxID=304207 RepID=UPI0004156FAE|nr:DUF2975 domain-containing protein [Schleiferilactobacillus harbinensis]QFR62794.1 DUF2975 domain-containing protein [Schleiferilactobacillus harbinensis]